MVNLDIVQSSNSQISSALSQGLVAVFVGATSGIGEITLKKFAKYSIKPRVYFIGRSQEAGERIEAQCREINATGEFTFIKADVSLMRVVDSVCETIKAKEKSVNILFLSAGVISFDHSKTSENLHLLTAIQFYSRFRFITNLLPLLQNASSLRHVVTVGGGGNEGKLDTNDYPALRIPLTAVRGHLTTLITLALEGIAKTAPEVSFVHDYPGAVNTPLFSRVPGIVGVAMRVWIFLVGWWVFVPIEESGERHLYLATSARFPPAKGESDSVPLQVGDGVARGATGWVGSGVYSVQWNGESASLAVEKVLAGYRDKGVVEDILKHLETEFKQITG